MPNLLFVDACVRGAESRTLQLCNAFLETFRQAHPDWTVDRVRPADLDLPPFSADMLAQKNALVESGTRGKAEFSLAWQFAEADRIVVGAPYWDLSFPAALKMYVEHVSVCDVTFRYGAQWLEGLCRAEKLAYITTAGGPLAGANYGYDFFCGLCRQFGIGCCVLVSAEGLDMENADVPRAMSKAEHRARKAAQCF